MAYIREEKAILYKEPKFIKSIFNIDTSGKNVVWLKPRLYGTVRYMELTEAEVCGSLFGKD